MKLVGAEIQGTLECRKGLFINPGKSALQATGIKVNGSVMLHDGFRAEGMVDLVGATIGGNLECNQGVFIGVSINEGEGKGKVAINADRLKVHGDVYMCQGTWHGSIKVYTDGFEADGEVKLVGAEIGGTFACGGDPKKPEIKGGQFKNAGEPALQARGVKVAGNVLLRNGFKAQGQVCLVGATIDGNLDCKSGHFINKDKIALLANHMKVENNILLSDAFEADGEVSLVGARIGGFLYWYDVASPEKVKLDLRSAKVQTLRDDKKSWKKIGKLLLHNFTYNEIHDKAHVEDRIEWLRLQYKDEGDSHDDKKNNEVKIEDKFLPQTYEQLAEVFRNAGRDADAKKILIAKNEDRAKWGPELSPLQKVWYRQIGPIIGYGYQPAKAFWLIVMIIIFGCVLFGIGYWDHQITPHTDRAYVKSGSNISIDIKDQQLMDIYPKFNFLVYSIDTFVPIIDLHQAKYWLPNPNRGPELFTIAKLPVRTGGILRLYLWIHISMGWILTTLLVVGLTGLVRT